MQVAEFRRTFRDLEEPVEVERYGERVGTWYPAGTEVAKTAVAPPVPLRAVPGERPFRPVPKPGTKR